MTDADKNVSQERSYEQVVDDAHVTLTTTEKTEGSIQSSSVSSDFASKFLNLDNVPPADNEVASMMNVKVRQEESTTLAPPLLTVPVTASPETSTVAATTVPLILQQFSSIPQMTTPNPIPTTEPTTSSIHVLPKFASLIGFDQRVPALELELSQVKQILDKDLIDSYGKAYSLKRGRDDKDKEEDPPTGLKKRKTSKDDEPPTGSKSKESKSSSSKGTKSQPKTFGKSVQAEEPVFETVDTEMPQDQRGNLGNTEDQPNVEEASKHDWFKKLKRPLTPDPDWNTGKQIDFRPPQT
ncbi:hypothetical protein Tco_0445926 [Tanacetum coccineum]